MKKLYGLLCALTIAASVPVCVAADAPPAAEAAAPAATTAPAAAAAPAATAPAEAAAPAATAPAEAAAPAATTAAPAVAPAVPEKPALPAMSDKEKMSYAIGASWGLQLKSVNLDLAMESLFQGMSDAMGGHKLALSDAEMRSALERMQTAVKEKQQEHMKEITARMKELGDKNKVEGPKFLDENKKKEGVVTLPSGLQYKVLKAGEGKLPGPTDVVTINYRGMFTDGTEFDSSIKHGQPMDVALDGSFIPGMTDALKMMKVGSKWVIYIPPDLAYGERGMPPIIGPSAVLVFEVEVLSTKEKPKDTAPLQ